MRGSIVIVVLAVVLAVSVSSSHEETNLMGVLLKKLLRPIPASADSDHHGYHDEHHHGDHDEHHHGDHDEHHHGDHDEHQHGDHDEHHHGDHDEHHHGDHDEHHHGDHDEHHHDDHDEHHHGDHHLHNGSHHYPCEYHPKGCHPGDDSKKDTEPTHTRGHNGTPSTPLGAEKGIGRRVLEASPTKSFVFPESDENSDEDDFDYEYMR